MAEGYKLGSSSSTVETFTVWRSRSWKCPVSLDRGDEDTEDGPTISSSRYLAVDAELPPEEVVQVAVLLASSSLEELDFLWDECKTAVTGWPIMVISVSGFFCLNADGIRNLWPSVDFDLGGDW